MAKITQKQLKQMFPTLDHLMRAIESGKLDEYGEDIEWSELPLYSAFPIENTIEVWSWDDTRKIVGTCTEDMHIEDRTDR